MQYYFGLIALAPWLVLQGKRVRRDTPRLPEPEGERFGVAGQGPLLHLLVTGDSAAAGVGVETQQQALSGCLVEELSKSRTVQWRLLAKTGDASAELLVRLREQSAMSINLAVISIGVNDVTGQVSKAQWRRNLLDLIQVLSTRHSVETIYFTAIPPMHLFPALPEPLRWWLGTRARQLNDILRCVVKEDERCRIIQVPYQGSADEIAKDGFHPGPKAYRAWARYLAADLDDRCPQSPE